jgi:glycosyltransferase involved in cell wall biosynthesis
MDVLVHCSLREGLARVLPQALLAGKPVISFDVDGAREVVVPGKTGWLVAPRDIPGLQQAMRSALNDMDGARVLAENGRALCQQRFDWRLMVVQLLELYAELLRNKK